ncbi:MAG TPA: hypothetical protein ENN30_02250 [Candidatus Woesearchaeota archaeon]|nr:hypothetical protein [Candidatus Woesearchaeota archaeon]
MKKAQGLPINFIVIAALAILVLILAAGFLIGGGASAGGALGPTQVANTCNGYCQNLQRAAASQAKPDGGMATWEDGINSRYCKSTFAVEGSAVDKSCLDMGIVCRVTFVDGSTGTVECGVSESTDGDATPAL